MVYLKDPKFLICTTIQTFGFFFFNAFNIFYAHQGRPSPLSQEQRTKISATKNKIISRILFNMKLEQVTNKKTGVSVKIQN